MPRRPRRDPDEAAARAEILASIARRRAPAPPTMSLPFRLRPRRKAAPIPARLGEGHLMFRLLRNPWREFQAKGWSFGWRGFQHNHWPADQMPWWPR